MNLSVRSLSANLAFALVATLGLFLASGCPAPADPVPTGTPTLSISPVEVRLEPGATQQFTATIAGTEDTRVRWQVVPSNGAQIDENGLLHAPNGKGTFEVKATLTRHSNVTATAKVTVAEAPPQIVLDISEATLGAGEPFEFSYRLEPALGSVALEAEVSVGLGGVVPSFDGNSAVFIAPETPGTSVVRIFAPEREDIEPALITFHVVEQATLGVLRGTVAYDGPETGRIYISWGEEASETTFYSRRSTSIPGPGSWSLQPLTHEERGKHVWAFMDANGDGAFTPALDPATIVPFLFTGAPESNLALTLSPPIAPELEEPFFMVHGAQTTEGVLLYLQASRFKDPAEAYTLTWTRVDLPDAPVLGTTTFEAGSGTLNGYVANLEFPDDAEYQLHITPSIGARVGTRFTWPIPFSRKPTAPGTSTLQLEGTFEVSGASPPGGRLSIYFVPEGAQTAVSVTVPVTGPTGTWSMAVPDARGQLHYAWDLDGDSNFEIGEPGTITTVGPQALVHPGVDRPTLALETQRINPLGWTSARLDPGSEGPLGDHTRFRLIGVIPGVGPRPVGAQLRGGQGLPVPFDLPFRGDGAFFVETFDSAWSPDADYEVAVTLADGTTELHPLVVRTLPAPELTLQVGDMVGGKLVVKTLQPEFVWTLATVTAQRPLSVLVNLRAGSANWSINLSGAAEMRATFGTGGRTTGSLTDGASFTLSIVVTDASGSTTERYWSGRVELP